MAEKSKILRSPSELSTGWLSANSDKNFDKEYQKAKEKQDKSNINKDNIIDSDSKRFSVINVSTQENIKEPVQTEEYEEGLRNIDDGERANYQKVGSYAPSKNQPETDEKFKDYFDYKNDGGGEERRYKSDTTYTITNPSSKPDLIPFSYTQKDYATSTLGLEINDKKGNNGTIKSQVMKEGDTSNNKTSNGKESAHSAEDLRLQKSLDEIISYWRGRLVGGNRNDLFDFKSNPYNFIKTALTNRISKLTAEKESITPSDLKSKNKISEIKRFIMFAEQSLKDINQAIDKKIPIPSDKFFSISEEKGEEELKKIHANSIVSIDNNGNRVAYKITKVEGEKVFYHDIRKPSEIEEMGLKYFQKIVLNPKTKILDVKKSEIKNSSSEPKIKSVVENKAVVKPEAKKVLETNIQDSADYREVLKLADDYGFILNTPDIIKRALRVSAERAQELFDEYSKHFKKEEPAPVEIKEEVKNIAEEKDPKIERIAELKKSILKGFAEKKSIEEKKARLQELLEIINRKEGNTSDEANTETLINKLASELGNETSIYVERPGDKIYVPEVIELNKQTEKEVVQADTNNMGDHYDFLASIENRKNSSEVVGEPEDISKPIELYNNPSEKSSENLQDEIENIKEFKEKDGNLTIQNVPTKDGVRDILIYKREGDIYFTYLIKYIDGKPEGSALKTTKDELIAFVNAKHNSTPEAEETSTKDSVAGEIKQEEKKSKIERFGEQEMGNSMMSGLKEILKNYNPEIKKFEFKIGGNGVLLETSIKIHNPNGTVKISVPLVNKDGVLVLGNNIKMEKGFLSNKKVFDVLDSRLPELIPSIKKYFESKLQSPIDSISFDKKQLIVSKSENRLEL